MKRTQSPRRISKKALAANGNKIPFSSIRKSGKPIRKKPRKPSETLRIYGPPARRKFVKSLPCCTCGVEGHTDQAHVAPPGEKGTGYKAGYLWIVPLCADRGEEFLGGDVLGCHTLYDRFPWTFNRRFPDLDPTLAAAETERLWLAHSGAAK